MLGIAAATVCAFAAGVIAGLAYFEARWCRAQQADVLRAVQQLAESQRSANANVAAILQTQQRINEGLAFLLARRGYAPPPKP